MSITTELREWARDNTVQGEVLTTHPAQHPVHGTLESLLAIADRIDAEHQKATAGCIHYDPERHYCSVHGDTENGWVKLPVDADGVPIHVGDVIDERLPFGGYAAPAPVDVMELSRGANGYGWMVRLDAANSAFISPKLLRHHHPPTVEDVLEEFAQMYIACNDKGTIAEYAKRLRLAGEDE